MISENLRNIVWGYIDQTFKPYTIHKHHSEEYKWAVDKHSNFIFEYHPDDGIGIDDKLYRKLESFFNLNVKEVDDILYDWFEENIPEFEERVFYNIEEI